MHSSFVHVCAIDSVSQVVEFILWGLVCQNSIYRISANSFRGNYSFLNFFVCTVTLKVRKLFAEIRYSQEIIIFVIDCQVHKIFKRWTLKDNFQAFYFFKCCPIFIDSTLCLFTK